MQISVKTGPARRKQAQFRIQRSQTTLKEVFVLWLSTNFLKYLYMFLVIKIFINTGCFFIALVFFLIIYMRIFSFDSFFLDF